MLLRVYDFGGWERGGSWGDLLLTIVNSRIVDNFL
jgi:hypothetical protein